MNLEFKIYKLKENSTYYKMCSNYNKNNEFIIVGEGNALDRFGYFNVLQLDKTGITLIGGLNLKELSLMIPKEELENKVNLGWEIQELDIPKEYLTMDIIEDIKRLNEV